MLNAREDQREQAEAEALETAKAEAIEELTADGVTSDLWFELINKANTIEGVGSLKNDILNARERQRQEAVALEVGKTAAIADLEDLLGTSVTEDLTDDEKALINDAKSLEEVNKVKAEIIDNRSEVYTLKFIKDGEKDYRNTKALHPGEAREVFLNFIQEEDLVVVVLHYDEETNTFTAVPDGGELEVREEEGYDFLPDGVLEFEEIQDKANAQLLREAQALQQAKEKSYEQLNAAGITSKGLYERIANANSVEEVEPLTEVFLESRRQQLAQDLAVAKAQAIEELDANEAESARINNANSAEELAQVIEEIQSERALQLAKGEAIVELEADGETSEADRQRIHQADSIEEVERVKEYILYERLSFLERIKYGFNRLGDWFRGIFQ
ncbi:albumin-binding GA domain-containing protein [Alloiococcus otitis]|uniref:albumin-binding GA domain-containing protein n=1 Tax=Alloiococcus otitis TaxID=1652 RepID=UPI00315CE220